MRKFTFFSLISYATFSRNKIREKYEIFALLHFPHFRLTLKKRKTFRVFIKRTKCKIIRNFWRNFFCKTTFPFRWKAYTTVEFMFLFCLSAMWPLYPINVKTVELIGAKFAEGYYILCCMYKMLYILFIKALCQIKRR